MRDLMPTLCGKILRIALMICLLILLVQAPFAWAEGTADPVSETQAAEITSIVEEEAPEAVPAEETTSTEPPAAEGLSDAAEISPSEADNNSSDATGSKAGDSNDTASSKSDRKDTSGSVSRKSKGLSDDPADDPGENPDEPDEPEEPVITGWDESHTHYYDADGNLVTGFFKADGSLYYSDDSGTLVTGKALQLGGKTYHIGTDGKIITGVHTWEKKYYFSSNEGVIRENKGFVTSGGAIYYVTNGGALKTGEKFKVGKNTYFAAANGKLKTGAFKWGKNYYFTDAKGVWKTTAGFAKAKGRVYYVEKGGKIRTAKTFKIKGKTYHACKDGHLATGVYKLGKKYYYAGADGARRTKQGFVTWQGKKYYNKKGGGLKVKSILLVGGKYYFVGAKAYVLTSTFTYKGVSVRPNSKTGEITPGSRLRSVLPVKIRYPKYILIDISRQKLWYYVNGKLSLKSSVVTGCVAEGHDTPTGKFAIRSKSRDVELKGDDYVSHVDYWMNFLYNAYGMHDATWRGSFGGKIYKYNGSHGCVNMPYRNAKKLYNRASVGTVVIIQK